MNTQVKVGDERKNHLDGLAISLIIVCCVLWGFQQIAIKSIANEIPLLMQATIRSIGDSFCIWLLMRYKKFPVFKNDQTVLPGILSVFLFFLEFACLFAGLAYTNTSRGIIFLYLSPFIVASVLPFFIKSERLNKIQTAGLVLAFLGLAFMFQEGFSQFKDTYLKGDILVLMAAVAWGLTTVLVRASKLSPIQPERTIFYQLLFSSVFFVIYCFIADVKLPQTVSPIAIASMFLQTVVIASVSYLTWFWLLRHYQATKVSAFGFLTPIFGLIFSVLLMGDPFSVQLLVGLAGVAAGILLVNRK
jgi:drug/metabolite transporter (DMT)-like permease